VRAVSCARVLRINPPSTVPTSAATQRNPHQQACWPESPPA
jgi:hypothetical protein